MSANRNKILSLTIALSLIAGPAPLQAQDGIGAELGSMLGQTAGAISMLNQQRQLQEDQKQLLQALNSEQAQLLQQQINATAQDLTNVVSRDLLPCLQRNSIAASSISAATSNPATVVVGQTSCKDPKVDISTFEEEMTCGNAERAKTEAEKEKKYRACRQKQMEALERVVSCFDGFEEKMRGAASKLQSALASRDSFVKQAIDAFTKNMEGHQQAIDRITAEVDGKDGYKDQVAKLDAILEALDKSLAGPAGNADRTPSTALEVDGRQLNGSLEERYRHLTSSEGLALSNAMFEQIAGETERCFVAGATSCDSSVGALPANQCLARIVCLADTAGTAGTRGARCRRNQEALAKITGEIGADASFNQRSGAGDLDPLDEKSIIEAASSERGRLQAIVLRQLDRYRESAVGRQQGLPDDQADFLVGKINEQIERCHAKSIKTFSTLYNSKRASGNPIRQAMEAYRTKQIQLQEDLNGWIRIVADRMTTFRTKFTSTFSSTLKQFASDCNAAGSGAVSTLDGTGQTTQLLACLKTLRARLEGGLNGTNGEPPTIIQVPVISGTPGAAGAGQQVIQQRCTGFKDCIQQLDVARRIHGEQKQALQSQRQATAQEHNKIVEGMFTQVAAAFKSIAGSPAGLQGMLDRVNNMLNSNGIAKRIGLKSRLTDDDAGGTGSDLTKGEDPKDDERSRIYGVPSNILAVLEKKGGPQALDQEAVDEAKKLIDEKLGESGSGKGENGTGIKGRLSKAERVLGKARDKVRVCTPAAEDYMPIGRIRCDGTLLRICSSNITSVLSQTQKIATIVANDQQDGRSSGLSVRQRNLSSFSECIRDQRELENLSKDDRASCLLLNEGNPRARALCLQSSQSSTMATSRDLGCYSETLDTVTSLFAKANPTYRSSHNALLGEIGELIAACDAFRTRQAEGSEASKKREGRTISTVDAKYQKCLTDRKGSSKKESVMKEVQEIVDMADKIEVIDSNGALGVPKDNTLWLPAASVKFFEKEKAVQKWLDSKVRALTNELSLPDRKGTPSKAFLEELFTRREESFKSFLDFVVGDKSFKYIGPQVYEFKADWNSYMDKLKELIDKNPKTKALLASIDEKLAAAAKEPDDCEEARNYVLDALDQVDNKRNEEYEKEFGPPIRKACAAIQDQGKSLEAGASTGVGRDGEDMFREGAR